MNGMNVDLFDDDFLIIGYSRGSIDVALGAMADDVSPLVSIFKRLIGWTLCGVCGLGLKGSWLIIHSFLVLWLLLI